MITCENCGCRVYRGICSNCEEESYILEFQGEFVGAISEEFLSAAQQQEEAIQQRRAHIKRQLQANISTRADAVQGGQ